MHGNLKRFYLSLSARIKSHWLASKQTRKCCSLLSDFYFAKMATQEYLLRYIESSSSYTELPSRLKLVINEEEWTKRWGETSCTKMLVTQSLLAWRVCCWSGSENIQSIRDYLGKLRRLEEYAMNGRITKGLSKVTDNWRGWVLASHRNILTLLIWLATPKRVIL